MKNTTLFFILNNSSDPRDFRTNDLCQQTPNHAGINHWQIKYVLDSRLLDSGESYEFKKSTPTTKSYDSSIKNTDTFCFTRKTSFSSLKTDSKLFFKKFDFLFTFIVRPVLQVTRAKALLFWLFSTFFQHFASIIRHFLRNFVNLKRRTSRITEIARQR